jgi:hypothetical protein
VSVSESGMRDEHRCRIGSVLHQWRQDMRSKSFLLCHSPETRAANRDEDSCASLAASSNEYGTSLSVVKVRSSMKR